MKSSYLIITISVEARSTSKHKTKLRESYLSNGQSGAQ